MWGVLHILALCHTLLEGQRSHCYDRSAKFTEEETEKLAAAMKQTAAIEK